MGLAVQRRIDRALTTPPSLRVTMCLFAVVLGLAACKPDTKAEAPEPRPVRTVTAAPEASGDRVGLTGHIAAEDEVALAFRISGRMIERPVNVGDHVDAGQHLARLDAQN